MANGNEQARALGTAAEDAAEIVSEVRQAETPEARAELVDVLREHFRRADLIVLDLQSDGEPAQPERIGARTNRTRQQIIDDQNAARTLTIGRRRPRVRL